MNDNQVGPDGERLTGARKAMVDAGMNMLLTSAPAALRYLLSPSNLVSSGHAKVSRDTAYRVFRSDGEFTGADAAVVACSRRATDHEWSGLNATLNEIAAAYAADHATVRDRLFAAIEANVEASFDSLGWPVIRLFHGVALTSSPRWAGPRSTDPQDILLGETILADQRRFYAELTDVYEPLVRRMMSDVGLRPQGRTVRDVVRLTHCLLDGAVVRMFIDPTLSAADVADAIVRFGMSLGEPGSLDDPRRPKDVGRAKVFDTLVENAKLWWQQHPTATAADADAIADLSETNAGVLSMLFPSDSDLADSVVRSILVDGGFLGADGEAVSPSFVAAIIIGGLDRTAHAADSMPGAFATVTQQSPIVGSSLRNDSIDAVSDLLSEHDVKADAYEIGSALVEAAWGGTVQLAKQHNFMAIVRDLTLASDRI